MTNKSEIFKIIMLPNIIYKKYVHGKCKFNVSYKYEVNYKVR